MTVRCINCGFPCRKYGKTSAGKQRWYCNQCKITFTKLIDNSAKQLTQFLNWLFSKGTQQEMPGAGRTFRRHSCKFWEIWPMPPKIESPHDILFVDGIYLGRKACILICYDGTHVFKTLAGIMLYALGKELLHITTKDEAREWVQKLLQWRITFKAFLDEMTQDRNGNLQSTHKRLLQAYDLLVRLIHSNTLFVYLEDLKLEMPCPSTNNSIEGGVNAQLRALLRNHRGMSIERRIKAVCWWCYEHSPQPLSAAEILAVMPTDKSISKIYNSMSEQAQLKGVIPTWGDARAWSDLHNYDKLPFNKWD